jgi:integrase
MHYGRKGRVSSAWSESVRAIINRKILPHIGDMEAESFGVRDASRWHAMLSQTAPGAADRALAVLSKVFSLHLKMETPGIERNPCIGVDKNGGRQMERFLDDEEYGKVFDILANAHDVPLFARLGIKLILLTGCRESEIRKLRWCEYEPGRGDHGYIVIEHHKTAKYGGPKPIPLSEAARHVMDEIAEAHDIYSLDSYEYALPKTAGRGGYSAGRYEDAPYRYLGRFWADLRERIGLEDVRLHDFRHSFASMAIRGGMSLQMIGSLLGHRNVSTTARYAHLRDQDRIEAADKIGAAIEATKNT